MTEAQPRVLNAKTAAHYLGMSQGNFNKKVSPFIIEVPEAANKISFDRLDLDNWWEQHKQANGKPAKENIAWQKEAQALERKVTSGTLRRSSPASLFDKALEKRNLSKQSAT